MPMQFLSVSLLQVEMVVSWCVSSLESAVPGSISGLGTTLWSTIVRCVRSICRFALILCWACWRKQKVSDGAP